MHNNRLGKIIIWSLVAFVCLTALITWVQHRNIGMLTIYDIFPLLGLLAFSLMWTHYISGVVQRRLNLSPGTLDNYFIITSGVVLALIIMHPGLFYLQLFIDGFGLPPGSSLAYYTNTMARVAVFIGIVSLMIFLSFETRRRFGDRPWWKYIEYANIAAMFGIFYHALSLGGELEGWYRVLWILYAVVLAAAIIHNTFYDRRLKA